MRIGDESNFLRRALKSGKEMVVNPRFFLYYRTNRVQNFMKTFVRRLKRKEKGECYEKTLEEETFAFVGGSDCRR